MDILNSLGSKDKTSGVKDLTTTQEGMKSIDPALSANLQRGKNLLDSVGKVKDEVTQTLNESSTESTTSTQEEPARGETKNADGSWTTESALKEVKKLREENKATRLKYEESLSKLKDDTEHRMTVREKELERFIQAEQELQELKSKEADKKRDITERLAHREAALAEIKAKSESAERVWQEKLTKMESQLSQYQAEAEAQKEVYKSRLGEEMASVPAKYKGIADLIVKGAGDPRDALIALNEAKLQGVFEDKTVIVNHSVPGASDGARASKERLDEATKAARDKMNSSQKIKTALSGIRQGEANTAFKFNK